MDMHTDAEEREDDKDIGWTSYRLSNVPGEERYIEDCENDCCREGFYAIIVRVVEVGGNVGRHYRGRKRGIEWIGEKDNAYLRGPPSWWRLFVDDIRSYSNRSVGSV